ncbi:MAG: GatB/YqeY domain-containing protein [Clostridia bacterium]|nr:GatB/YqeY domain-containing protein [Clostridia bacterium]
MSLKEKLMEDLKESMKNHDEVKKNTITMIRAAVKQIEVDKRVELEDNDIIDIISKEAKKRKDALSEFEKAGREDLIAQTNEELAIIKEYLPEELSTEELTKIIEETIAEVGAETMKDMGKVMQAVKTKTAGRADGKTINEIVKSKLS